MNIMPAIRWRINIIELHMYLNIAYELNVVNTGFNTDFNHIALKLPRALIFIFLTKHFSFLFFKVGWLHCIKFFIGVATSAGGGFVF